MEDRYLCKAKRKDTGEWVEGYIIPRKYEGTDKIFEAHIVVDAYEQIGVLNMRRALVSEVGYEGFVVDSSTICQCTGLHDKNGKLIWENDILLQKTTEKHWCKWKCSGVVKYGEYDWNVVECGYKSIGFYVEPIIKNGDTTRIWCGLNQEYLVDECYPYEVIGNIFDNPELLEAGKEAGEQGNQDVLMPAT